MWTLIRPEDPKTAHFFLRRFHIVENFEIDGLGLFRFRILLDEFGVIVIHKSGEGDVRTGEKPDPFLDGSLEFYFRFRKRGRRIEQSVSVGRPDIFRVF